MFQADQKKIAQEANLALVQIRAYEIEYFNKFLTSFGIQSGIIVASIVGAISQTPVHPHTPHTANVPYFWQFLYFVTAAMSFSAATHCLLSTIFMTVYGQGLALRGPVGSMVRAIEGLVAEQHAVLVSFVVTIIVFQANNCFM
jgi:hypothetical protein